MITRNPQWLLEEFERGRIFPDAPPVARGVFLVEPLDFRVDPESATDNRYMQTQGTADSDRALEQFIGLASRIRDLGIPVKTFPGNPQTPDDVFPNNVFATIPGRLIVGSMLHPTRRLEAGRRDIRGWFEGQGYELVDLASESCIAELTGVMVIDRAHRVGYCGMTQRVNDDGLKAMHDAFDLRHTLQFDLQPSEYHTNVVLSVLASRAAVLHAPAFVDQHVPRAIEGIYQGRTLWLDDSEKAAFAGNCIALTQHDLFMSEAAADALRPSSRALLESWRFRLRVSPLDEIEKAGGSLRCMVAEIY